MSLEGYRRHLGATRVPGHVPPEDAQRSRNCDQDLRVHGLFDRWRRRPDFGMGGHGGDSVYDVAQAREATPGVRIWWAIAAREAVHDGLARALDALAPRLRRAHQALAGAPAAACTGTSANLGDVIALQLLPGLADTLQAARHSLASTGAGQSVSELAGLEIAQAELPEDLAAVACDADLAAREAARAIDGALEGPSPESLEAALGCMGALATSRDREARALGMLPRPRPSGPPRLAPSPPAAAHASQAQRVVAAPPVAEAPSVQLTELRDVIALYAARAATVPQTVAAVAVDLESWGYQGAARHWARRSARRPAILNVLLKKEVIRSGQTRRAEGPGVACGQQQAMMRNILWEQRETIGQHADLSSLLTLSQVNRAWRGFVLGPGHFGAMNLCARANAHLALDEGFLPPGGHALAREVRRISSAQSRIRSGICGDITVRRLVDATPLQGSAGTTCRYGYRQGRRDTAEGLEVIDLEAAMDAAARCRFFELGPAEAVQASPQGSRLLLSNRWRAPGEWTLVDLEAGSVHPFRADIAVFDGDSHVWAARLPALGAADAAPLRLEEGSWTVKPAAADGPIIGILPTTSEHLRLSINFPVRHACLLCCRTGQRRFEFPLDSFGTPLFASVRGPPLLSLDGAWLVAKTAPRQVQVRDPRDPDFAEELCFDEHVRALALSRRGGLLATATASSLYLHQLTTGAQIATVDWRGRPQVLSLDFARGGDALMVGASSDGSIRRVDVVRPPWGSWDLSPAP